MFALVACRDDTGSSAEDTGSPQPTSPTGSGPELAFQTRGSIWTQAPGQAAVNVAPEVDSNNEHPDWSPDGAQIAFEAEFKTIWTVGHDGTGEQERFTCADPCYAVSEPAWSPDGSTLAFMQFLGDGTHTVSSQLMTLDLETGATSVVHEDTAGEVAEYTPRWSGDGSQVVLEHDVFASDLADEEEVVSSDLRVVDTVTGATTTIRGTDGGESPDWSPIDELIVYTDDGNLFTIHSDGSHKQQLTQFRVKHESAIQPTFTPDGTGVIFTWIDGVQFSGTESTVPGVVDLSTGDITAMEDAKGATHARVRP